MGRSNLQEAWLKVVTSSKGRNGHSENACRSSSPTRANNSLAATLDNISENGSGPSSARGSILTVQYTGGITKTDSLSSVSSGDENIRYWNENSTMKVDDDSESDWEEELVRQMVRYDETRQRWSTTTDNSVESVQSSGTSIPEIKKGIVFKRRSLFDRDGINSSLKVKFLTLLTF